MYSTGRNVIVRQTGGLGNQLFQYAMGRFIATTHQRDLYVACELPRRMHFAHHPRPLLLQQFAIAAPLKTVSTLQRMIISERGMLSLPSGAARRLTSSFVVREKPGRALFCDEVVFPEKVKNLFLSGYWQTYSRVRRVESLLREEFQFRRDPTGRNLEMAKHIVQSLNPVSVHIRRGGYAKAFGDNVLLPNNYYDSALRIMAEKLGSITLYIFSDDPRAALEWAVNKKCIVVSHNEKQADEDLRLMSLCHHHVIANSTFSWWGAWLNPRSDKSVIAPSTWSRVDTRATDILPKSWAVTW